MASWKLIEIEEFLRRRGQKVTSRRRLLLKEILGMHRHFTAEELYDRIRKGKNPPSKATVYRLLALLVEGKLLDTHQFGDRHLYYEIATDEEHHDHMLCVQCGRIVEFSSGELEDLQQHILERHGFQMLYHSHKIYGLCRPCGRSGKRSPAGGGGGRARAKPSRRSGR